MSDSAGWISPKELSPQLYRRAEKSSRGLAWYRLKAVRLRTIENSPECDGGQLESPALCQKYVSLVPLPRWPSFNPSEPPFGGGPGWLRIRERRSIFPGRTVPGVCSSLSDWTDDLSQQLARLCCFLKSHIGLIMGPQLPFGQGWGSSVSNDSFAYSLYHLKVHSANTQLGLLLSNESLCPVLLRPWRTK